MNTLSISLNDPVFVKKSNKNAFERFMLRYIRDERDMPFIYLCIKLTLLTIPVAIFLFLPGMFTWWVAAPYLVVLLGVFLGPFVLMLHNTSHRILFKKDYNFMNNYIPWVLGPFFGESPETYFHHHVAMHHPENNMEEDISSTLSYQRDSIIDFFKYFGTFFFYGIVQLSMYFKKKQRPKFIKKTLMGEFSFFLLCISLSFISFKATLVIFIIPFFFVRFAMMAGNWAQHAFIDASDPENCYKNSITCINSVYNKRCFNDGYHIGHHLYPAMHWTDMPHNFEKNIDKYVEEKAVIFEGIDYFFIWFLLVTHSYGYLAKRFVDLGGTFNGKEEIVAFLKERTKKIS